MKYLLALPYRRTNWSDGIGDNNCGSGESCRSEILDWEYSQIERQNTKLGETYCYFVKQLCSEEPLFISATVGRYLWRTHSPSWLGSYACCLLARGHQLCFGPRNRFKMIYLWMEPKSIFSFFVVWHCHHESQDLLLISGVIHRRWRCSLTNAGTIRKSSSPKDFCIKYRVISRTVTKRNERHAKAIDRLASICPRGL